MRPKIRSKLTTDEQKVIRGIIRKARWTHSSSPQYRTAPHSYIVRFRPLGFTKRQWDRLARTIRRCGTAERWRGQRYVYLRLDGYCYWVMWPVLNRTKASTLDR